MAQKCVKGNIEEMNRISNGSMILIIVMIVGTGFAIFGFFGSRDGLRASVR